MKKFITGAVAALMAGFLSAQVMPSAGVENTVFTGFGSPLSGDPVYYGVIDVLQARVDVGQFTLEGMINWGALAYCDGDGDLDFFKFEITNRNALSYHYSAHQTNEEELHYSYVGNVYNYNYKNDPVGLVRKQNNGYLNGQTLADEYYVNFLWHPFANFDVGLGTKLNWQVGPAPRFGSWLWESDAHIRQGGFSTHYDDRHGSVGEYQFIPDAPGSADVVGFVPYANKYAKTAIGARWYYQSSDFTMQIGAAIPNGTDTDNFRNNVGFQIAFENFTISSVYEGLFQQNGNLYAGVGFGVKQLFIDAYFAWDHIDTNGADTDDQKYMSNAIGGAVTINFDKIGLTLRPETSFNWFENTNYLPSWYVGANAIWNFNDKFEFGCWSSFAIGSKDKRWDDVPETKDWSTGNIFDIRPEAKFFFDKNNSFAAFMDLEHREAFDGKGRWAWSTGAYWTYKLETGKATASKKSSKRR